MPVMSATGFDPLLGHYQWALSNYEGKCIKTYTYIHNTACTNRPIIHKDTILHAPTEQLYIIKYKNTNGKNPEIIQRPKMDKYDIKYFDVHRPVIVILFLW